MPVWLKALSAQGLAVLSAYLTARTAASLGVAFAPEVVVAVQATAAVLMALALGLPVWWLPLQAVFGPALLMALSLRAPSALFLAGFLLLWLAFRHSAGDRVPLYLSNRLTWRRLQELLPRQEGIRFIDLGCGLGGLVAYLASVRQDSYICGVESAPLPWLISRIRLLGRRNAAIRYDDIRRMNLADYDVVYVFLSPDPMPMLWVKARQEMRPGTLLISNSFDVPGVPPTRTVVLDDRRRTRLLVWRM
ncbi:class I SAM-dependent methyltransferase [Methylococcus sp. EFPC2]|nr:class I SAM-dependent methyltransferase [Methylococcus sp. EFPC2]